MRIVNMKSLRFHRLGFFRVVFLGGEGGGGIFQEEVF